MNAIKNKLEQEILELEEKMVNGEFTCDNLHILNMQTETLKNILKIEALKMNLMNRSHHYRDPNEPK